MKDKRQNTHEKLVTFDSISKKLSYLLNCMEKEEKETPNKLIKFHNYIEEYYEEHFEKWSEGVEFCYWFLKYNARIMFEDYINKPEFQDKLNHPHFDKLLNHEISIINSIEDMANELGFDYLEKHNKGGFLHLFDNDLVECREFYRVSGDYYEKHKTEYSYLTIKSPEVKAYFKHILFKPFLNGRIKKSNSINSTLFSQKQVAIAYFCLGIRITQNNYLEILERYTNTTSNKILQKLIVKTNQLTRLSENKTADSKHIKDLKEAKRLINDFDDRNAEHQICQAISDFEDNFNFYYD